MPNDIKEAKDWFEKNEANITSGIKNHEIFKTTPIEKIQKTPNWAFNLTHINFEGRTVIEVNLDVDKEFVPKDFLDKTKTKNRAEYHVLHHLLLAKTNSGDYDAFILKIFSETNLGLKGKKNIFENLNYGNTPNDFTGYMVLTTIDDEVLKGWIFEDGRIIKTNRPVDPQSKKINSLSFSWECGFVETHWYSQACGASGCSEPVLIDITYDYECNDSGDSSSLDKQAASLEPAGPGGGGGGFGDPIKEEEEDGIDCSSFIFVPTNSTWQEAAITNIGFKIRTIDNLSGSYIVNELRINRPIWFGLPVTTYNNLVISPGNAADIAASAVQYASDLTYALYRQNPDMLSSLAESIFIQHLKSKMLEKGGRADYGGSGSNLVVPTVASYKLFGNGNCN